MLLKGSIVSHRHENEKLQKFQDIQKLKTNLDELSGITSMPCSSKILHSFSPVMVEPSSISIYI